MSFKKPDFTALLKNILSGKASNVGITTIHTRINLLLYATGLIFLLLLFFLYRTTSHQEELILKESSNQFQNEANSQVNNKIETLKQVAADYTFWDDFVRNLNKIDTSWYRNNITTILKSFHLDAVAVYDTSFQLVHKASEPLCGIDAHYSKEILEKLKQEKFSAFFLNTDEGLFAISSASVHPDIDPTHTLTRPSGYLFLAKKWDPASLASESGMSGVQVSLVTSLGKLDTNEPYLTTISVPVIGWNNQTIGQFVFKRSSNILKLYRQISLYMFLTMLISIIITWLLLSFTFRKWLTKPLKLVTKILETEDGGLIQELKECPGEFEKIGLLFSEFVDQKRELVCAKEKAEESDLLKSAFLANMSHEIRTPMNGILGFVELLKEPKLTGEELKEYIRIIDESGKRMLNIINDIICISKVEAGQNEVVSSETNINDHLRYIFTFFKRETEQKGIELSYQNGLSDFDANVLTDKEKVYAIITNLVKNAIKFTHSGSIKFGYVKKGKYLEFYVRDTGVGIRTEQQKVIFERFRQASESLSRQYEGAGLGLAISKAYVEMLGGEIWVESDPEGTNMEKGSVFYFSIPYVRNNFNEIELDSNQFIPLEKCNIKKLKILIADDDPVSEIFIGQLVRTFSKEILIENTGHGAVDACKNHPDIDLVLMDIQMPDTDGYEATRQIREFNREVVIIAQTALGLKGEREKVMAAGCTDYLSKPIAIAAFTAMIRKYFETTE